MVLQAITVTRGTQAYTMTKVLYLVSGILQSSKPSTLFWPVLRGRTCCPDRTCIVHVPCSIAIAQLERELTSTVSKLHEEQRGRALAEQIAKDKVGGAACICMCLLHVLKA